MAPSRKSLKKVKDLNEKRLAKDSAAVQEWDKLIKVYDRKESTKTEPNLQGDDLRDLIKNLAEFLDKQIEEGENREPCTESHPCGGVKVDIDLEALSELVFRRLIFEARLERERTGWWN